MVCLEGGFFAYRLGLVATYDGSIVDSVGELHKPCTVLPKGCFQKAGRNRSQVTGSANPVVLKHLGRFGTYAGYPADREILEELQCVLGTNHPQAVGLCFFGGDFGQVLAVRDACRDRDSDFLSDLFSNACGYESPVFGSHVEITLVHRDSFHKRRVPLTYLEHGLGSLRVLAHVRRQIDAVRAKPVRLGYGHGRAHAVLARLVRAGGNDSPGPRLRPDNERFAPVFRVVSHFNGREEGVGIYQDDDSGPRGQQALLPGKVYQVRRDRVGVASTDPDGGSSREEAAREKVRRVFPADREL